MTATQDASVDCKVLSGRARYRCRLRLHRGQQFRPFLRKENLDHIRYPELFHRQTSRGAELSRAAAQQCLWYDMSFRDVAQLHPCMLVHSCLVASKWKAGGRGDGRQMVTVPRTD